MKNLINKVQSKAANLKEKAMVKVAAILAPVAGALATIVPAAGLASTDPDVLIKSVFNIIFTLAKYVGAVLVVTGIFQLVMAYKDDYADAKTRGVTLAIVGIVLSGLQLILQTAGIIAK